MLLFINLACLVGVSRKGIPTASHKRRRAAGIPDLEFEVHCKLLIFVLLFI